MVLVQCRRVAIVVSLLLLCVVLQGCGVLNSGPSAAVVERAIAQKLTHIQTVLSQQLTGVDSASEPFYVGRVAIKSRQSLTIDNQPAVEVKGTYTLQGRSLSRSQERQLRDFDLFLQQGETSEDWLLLEPAPNQTTSDSTWKRTPLS